MTFALKMHEFNNRLKKKRGKAKRKEDISLYSEHMLHSAVQPGFPKELQCFHRQIYTLVNKNHLQSMPSKILGLNKVKHLQLPCLQWLSLIPTPALSIYPVLLQRAEEVSVSVNF